MHALCSMLSLKCICTCVISYRFVRQTSVCSLSPQKREQIAIAFVKAIAKSFYYTSKCNSCLIPFITTFAVVTMIQRLFCSNRTLSFFQSMLPRQYNSSFFFSRFTVQRLFLYSSTRHH